jgi:hypothetical protein
MEVCFPSHTTVLVLPLAGIQVRVGGQVTLGITFDVDPVSVQGIADQRRRVGGLGSLAHEACRDAVIVVDARLLWVAVAAVLYLVGDSIPPTCIECVEEDHAIQGHPDRPERCT